MSILIQLSEATERLTISQNQPDNFPSILRQVLTYKEFQLRHFSQAEDQYGYKKNQLLAILGKSQQTFIRDMEWKFFLYPEEMRLNVKFFNQQRDNFLKVTTQRMKLQLLILLRNVNEQLLTEEQFIVDPPTGLLEYHFRIFWAQYKVKIPKIESLRRFLIYLVSKIRQYQEIIYFCQPPILSNSEQTSAKLHLYDDFLKTTNNFRTLMRNTLNIRKMNSQILQKLRELKEYQTQNQMEETAVQQQKQQILILYQKNICQMYQTSIGLEKTLANQQIQTKCIQSINYHQNFKDKNNIRPGQSAFALNAQDKIVHGINVVKSDQQKNFCQQGAHSQITRGIFLFRLVKSIEIDVVKEQPQRWLMGTERKTQLTVKRCNLQNEASKNSFMNELYFLNYVRDFHSSFIGKYYLETKNFRQRNEKQPIYMKSYYQNVENIVKKCSTLSIKDKLTLLYQISLGLCFLSSKNILHRDFKPQNIVVNAALTPHIIDFGSCCSVYGTNSYTPYDKRLLTSKFIHIYYHELPEKFHYIYEKMSKQEYEQHPLFDIYSFGRMLCFVMFGTLDPPQYDRVAEDVHAELFKNLIYLIQMCLNVDPDDRPCAGQVTGFLGSLSKFYSGYFEFFLSKTGTKSEKRSHSQPKPST